MAIDGGGLGIHGAAALIMAVLALFLFTRDRLPLQFSCILVLVALAVGFEAYPYVRDGEQLRAADILSGFGNEALVTIVLLLVLAKAIEVSDALRPFARALARLWLTSRSIALLATLTASAALSAFVNNTPIVVMLLPLLVGVAYRTRTPASRVLMPFGFASIVGGMSTTIGTSSNLLVVSVASDLGLPRLGMFDFVLPAAIAASVAILYLWAVAPRLLPDRQAPLNRETPRVYESIIDVDEKSPLAGKTLSAVLGRLREKIDIHRVQRGHALDLVRLPSLSIRPGDRLHVRGTPAAIKEVQNLFGGGFGQDDLLHLPDQVLAEIVVTEESSLFGRRLSEIQGPVLSHLTLVGVFRPGRRATQSIDESSDPTLTGGDILLMQGDRRDIRELKNQHRFLILDRNVHVPRSGKAPMALGIMAAVVIVAALGWLPISAAALCGVALMLFGRCLSLSEAMSALDSKLILVIATSLALGTALTFTGAAEFLAMQFVDLVRALPPAVILSCIMLLTALLTEVVSNNAVAVITTPIAIVVAQELGAPELPFVLAVLFGANMSYMTPIGYQTNLLVYGAGGYRFSDFFRVGIPLQLLLWLTLSITLPILYL